jgi:hypothetical protein
MTRRFPIHGQQGPFSTRGNRLGREAELCKGSDAQYEASCIFMPLATHCYKGRFVHPSPSRITLTCFAAEMKEC